jgi:hypothetical protein
MKTEVYSWRVSTDLKSGLEREARRRKISLSALLDLAAREWLKKSGAEIQADEEEQLRLHNAASKCFGILAGGDAYRSEKAREAVRQHLCRRHDQ